MSDNKYATLTDVARAVEKLEEKVPSRWEVRSLILGAVVITNYDVPTQVTAAAIAAGAVGLAGKFLSVVFLRS
jgi:hypothetical protein